MFQIINNIQIHLHVRIRHFTLSIKDYYISGFSLYLVERVPIIKANFY